jgi:hypothetical protein
LKAGSFSILSSLQKNAAHVAQGFLLAKEQNGTAGAKSAARLAKTVIASRRRFGNYLG